MKIPIIYSDDVITVLFYVKVALLWIRHMTCKGYLDI